MLSQAFFIPKIYKFLFLRYILLEGRRMDLKKQYIPLKYIFSILKYVFFVKLKKGVTKNS